MYETIAQANAANNGRKTAYDGGTIEVYSGAKAADIASEPTGTLLAVLTFGSPAFGNSASRVLTANAITQDSAANASGTIGHIICKSSGGTVLSSHSASLSGGGGEAIFDSLSTVAGLPVSMSSFTITQPNGA